ncbi:hypothetical protein [Streptomyces sp. NPDC059814]|uniref:hypothetical protein n=1 Tax=Streptomyces sp. NPDC059814 TaxID=3346959 RepID=UPI0036515F74
MTSSDIGRAIFGVPLVLTKGEATAIRRDLDRLWTQCYSEPSGDLEADLDLCRRFFDPLARGGTLRDRLAELSAAPREVIQAGYVEPLVTDVGGGVLLVGVEARVLLWLLDTKDLDDGHIFLSPAEVAAMERMALDKYRAWSTARLNQVVALRSGRAAEVMQAVSVGLVIALLINRSDAPERAIPKMSKETPAGKQVNEAIYAGAERFAAVVVPKRSERSAEERRLKGGYGLSEASRRLAHRLVTIKRPGGEDLIHIAQISRPEVVRFLGLDLARRAGLTSNVLETAFDELIRAFRAEAGELAHRSMIFERAADTRRLKSDLMAAFDEARAGTLTSHT